MNRWRHGGRGVAYRRRSVRQIRTSAHGPGKVGEHSIMDKYADCDYSEMINTLWPGFINRKGLVSEHYISDKTLMYELLGR